MAGNLRSGEAGKKGEAEERINDPNGLGCPIARGGVVSTSEHWYRRGAPVANSVALARSLAHCQTRALSLSEIGLVMKPPPTLVASGRIDFDGKRSGLPFDQYRPAGWSMIYRIHLDPLRAKEIFSGADHFGTTAFDPAAPLLHPMNWGSRDFYPWQIPQSGAITDALFDLRILRRRNPSSYFDNEECPCRSAWLGTMSGDF